jgi:hypothetical protein
MILSHNSITFCTFYDKLHLLQTPIREYQAESSLENERAREWVLLSLSNDQEAQFPEKQKQEHDGESETVQDNWKTVPTETRRKAFLSIIPRKMSPGTVRPSKRKYQ